MDNGTTSGLPSLLPWSRLGTCWAEDRHMDMLDRRKKGPLVVPSSAWVRQDCAFHPLGKAVAECYGDGRRDAG